MDSKTPPKPPTPTTRQTKPNKRTTTSKKDMAKAATPSDDEKVVLDREEAEEFKAFMEARAAARGEESEGPKPIELDGEIFEIANLDEDVIGHIMFLQTFAGTEKDRMASLAEILEALLVPGEYERLSKVARNYVKRLRRERYEAELNGEQTDEEQPSITNLFMSIVNGITAEIDTAASHPKR